MNIENVVTTIRVLRKHGFQLVVSDAVTNACENDLSVYAVQATASLLNAASIEAFDAKGDWHGVASHVRENGLEPITREGSEKYGVKLHLLNIVNQIIHDSRRILEHIHRTSALA